MKGQIVEVAEGAHSELGPSSAERWLNCPGSVLASRGKPDVPSKYAIEGTAAHTVSEWVRKQRVPASTFKGISVRVLHSGGSSDVYCGKPMVAATQEFVDRVAVLPGIAITEGRVAYEEYVPSGFGTGDSFKLSDLLCHTGDFKYGTGVKKDADMNPQLLLYSLGIWLRYRWAFDFDTFVLTIYQPRLKHFPQAEITLPRLLEWVNDVAVPGARRALTPGAPFKAGSWCKFCRIRDDCLVRSAWMREQDVLSSPREDDFNVLNMED